VIFASTHSSDIREHRRREREKFEDFGVNLPKIEQLSLGFEKMSEKSGHGQEVFVRDLPKLVRVIFASADGAS